MNTKTNTAPTIETAAILQTNQDFKDALLVVSIMVNMFIFIAWLVIQVDPSVSLALLQTTYTL